MRRLNLFLACCLFALPALAQAPQPGPVPPPTPAPAPAPVPVVPVPKPMPLASVKVPDGPLYAGDLVVLDGSDSVGDVIDWEIISPPDVTTYVTDSNGKTVAFSNKTPGTYVFRIEAESVIGGRIARSKKRVSFTTLDHNPPAPTPTPIPVNPPTPTPPAPPAPTPVVTFARPAFVTLVVDSATMTPALASVRDSITVGPATLALGAHWLTLDVKSPEYGRRNLAAAVLAAGGAPCLIVQGSPATPGGPSPIVGRARADLLDEASTLAYIKSVVGGN